MSKNDYNERTIVSKLNSMTIGLSVIIEFIKEFLLNQLDKELVKDITDIRYDGSNEDSLIFYLVGINKSIGCKISFYEELLKQSEFKNIDSCIEVDKESYHNYFRLR